MRHIRTITHAIYCGVLSCYDECIRRNHGAHSEVCHSPLKVGWAAMTLRSTQKSVFRAQKGRSGEGERRRVGGGGYDWRGIAKLRVGAVLIPRLLDVPATCEAHLKNGSACAATLS